MMKFSFFPFSKQPVFVVWVVAILSVIIFLVELIFGDSLTNVLVYHRAFIIQGELWRLFTGHLLHTNGYHILLNLAALFMLWRLHGRFYTIKNFTALFVFCSLITSLGIYYGSPSLTQYVGLSGVLHGVFVFGALRDIAAKDKTGYLLFIGVWLKIVHEQLYGASVNIRDLIAADVAIDAHLWGAIGGLIFSIIYIGYLKNQQHTLNH